MKIKICISTCKQYSLKTVPILVESLKASGFPIADILVVDGGYDSEKSLFKDGINTIEVTHNSFDYTALITVVEKKVESDFWLLLHDTCKVGPDFCTLLYKANLSFKKVALRPAPSMSIGLYSYEYLLQHSDSIIALKNTDYSKEGLLRCKNDGFLAEDRFLWGTKDTPCGMFESNGAESSQALDPATYSSTTSRKQEYYPQLDLYKFKANWGQHWAGSPLVINI